MKKESYNNYSSYFIEYTGDINKSLEKVDYAFLYEMFPIAAMIYVENGKEEDLLEAIPNILSIEENLLFNTVILEQEYSLIPPKKLVHNNILSGKDVLIGIAGPGVNFLKDIFIDEDGQSRIVQIFDENIDLEDDKATYGREFSDKNLNRAIDFKRMGYNPYEIVPYMDESSYMESICSIIGHKDLGIVPKCKYAVVKLRAIRKKDLRNGISEEVYDTYGVLKAIDYLYKIKMREDKPMVVYLPIEGRTAIKDGSSVIEKAINYYSQLKDFIVVTTTGGNGNSGCYYSDVVKHEGSIKSEILNFTEEKLHNFGLSIGVHYLDQISIKLKCLTENEEVLIESNSWKGIRQEYNLSTGSIEALFLPPKNCSSMKELKVKFNNVNEKHWEIEVLGENINYGEINLSLDKSLSGITIFKNAKAANTLSIPAMARRAVVVTCYSKDEGDIRGISGKLDKTNLNILRPIAVDGTGMTAEVDTEYTRVKGVALSGAIATGMIAMMLQWAFIEGNKKDLTISDIRLRLIKSCNSPRANTTMEVYGVIDVDNFNRNFVTIDEYKS